MAWKTIRPHSLNVAGIILATVLFMFAFEQQQEIFTNWRGVSWEAPHTIVWGIHTSCGFTYDFTYALFFIAFVLIFISTWTWNDNKKG